jgi:hypothetical protein
VPGVARPTSSPSMRKHIVPGSVRIYGLPNTNRNFGIRDNGEGQMWSETRKVGFINYWTGDVVLAKEYIPKARRFRDELRSLLGLKIADPNVNYEYEYEYKVSFLDLQPVKRLSTTALSLTGDLSLTGRRRKG